MGVSGRYIGYTLSRLLDERDLKPADLSRMCDTSRSNVTMYTSGLKQMPRFEQAYDFAKALGLSLDLLWYECERDWRTERYERWLRIADRRYGRGEFEEKVVAGEGVEPPTQGFSVFALGG